MEALTHFQGLLIGLMGWAATAVLTMNSSRLNTHEKRWMVVFSWMIWMMPALGTLVYRGLLATDTALFVCGATTLLMGLGVSLSMIRWRTRL